MGSGETCDPNEMVRFALSPDGIVTPDITGKLPGRGVWVRSDRASLEAAVKNKGFARGFKKQVKLPEDLIALVEAGLARQLLSQISMARKSGQLILGFDQVMGLARAEAIGWRIEARDGSEDGRGKIRTLSKAVAREWEKPLPQVLGCFASDALSQAVGREHVIHAAIRRGRFARNLEYHAKRFSGFVALIPPDWPDYDHEMRGLTPQNGLS